jgi:L-ascorbate metabolism protein UlaG (beta-lactamase superfamily)
MLIKYLAHASFLMTAQNGTKILVDPYHSAPELNYSVINESADIVTSSHGHGDHNAVELVKGQPQVISAAGQYNVKGIAFKGIAAAHDELGGKKRGADVIFCFKIDGLNICHTGDLGHVLEASQVAAIKPVDILMIPVGGFFTIEPKLVDDIAASLGARIIIPMHFKTAKVGIPIGPLDAYLAGKKNVRRPNSSSLEISPIGLPAAPEIVVLNPAN